MKMQPIAPDTPLAVTLQAQQWNTILSIMQSVEAPYKITAPIIHAMQQQLIKPEEEPTTQPSGQEHKDVDNSDSPVDSSAA